MRLKDKTAVVTGGASGIGKAIVERFLADGASVVIGDVSVEKGKALAAQLGGMARFVAADASKSEDVAELVEQAISAFGKIDILVNNAGIVHVADFLDLKIEDFDRVLNVNLRGAFLLGQAVARHMVERVKAGGQQGRSLICRRSTPCSPLPIRCRIRFPRAG
jgi:glucose 1-dehydrogenase